MEYFFSFSYNVFFFIKTKFVIDVSGLAGTPPLLSVTDELLKKKFHLIYTVLEPREIADRMFQEGTISVNDHDYLTDNPRKEKRVRNLLYILKRKALYPYFLSVLEPFQYTSLIETLNTDRQSRNGPSK